MFDGYGVLFIERVDLSGLRGLAEEHPGYGLHTQNNAISKMLG